MEAEEDSGIIPGLQEVIKGINQEIMGDVVVHIGIDQVEEAVHLETVQEHQMEVEVLQGMEDPELMEDANNHILLLNWS